VRLRPRDARHRRRGRPGADEADGAVRQRRAPKLVAPGTLLDALKRAGRATPRWMCTRRSRSLAAIIRI
jgi:hypothetical protein